MDKEYIKRKLKNLEQDLEKIATLKKYTFQQIAGDFFKYSTAEHYLERIINRAIDLNNHLLSELKQEPPEDYFSSFTKLAKLKIFPKKFAQKIAQSTGLRNRLIHHYDEIDPKKVYESLGYALKEYPQYIKYILKFLDSQK